MKTLAVVIAILITSCGGKTQNLRSLAAESSFENPDTADYNNDSSADAEQSSPQLQEKIQEILNNKDKLEPLVQEISESLKGVDPLLKIEQSFLDKTVETIKNSNATSSQEIAEAVYPSIKELYETDPALAESPHKSIVIGMPDMIKAGISGQIDQYLSE